ncbi:MAG: hypothetical protein CSYNP_02594 [Syntrophus sp. SKADARSKE-3]|nr:hypothetical protein [Syntrophus sp. SKADARSKE-3]
MKEYVFHRIRGLIILFVVALTLSSCGNEGQVITRPGEALHTFEAGEKILTKAIIQVMKDKAFSNPVVDRQKNIVESDYVVDGDWRTKAVARISRISDRECEVALSIITEKKTDKGWELRRLLEKNQYDTFFSVIETQIYREMYKAE